MDHRIAALFFSILFITALPTQAQQWISYQKHDGTTVNLLASADTDGDGIDNELEINGFVFDLASGEIQPWDGDESKRHYFTDPLRASTDGDPYSDFMEVTGANMPGSIEAPYNHPLVAARPIIAVYMTSYEVIPNGEITDEEGGSRSEAYTNETTNEDTFGIGVSTEVSLNPLELASVEVDYNYSHTYSFTNSSTFSEEFNWNTARAVNEAEAARLRLNVYYVNMGSAPASNVRPTFTLKLGNKVIATFQSSLNSEAQALAPGGRFPANGSIAIDSYVAGEVDRDIVISLEELKALERGSPLSILVPQVEANILRWNESTQSFSNEITWSDYEQDIDPVSITLETNIGGEAAQYQVYTGSPQFADPLRNLRETLELVFDVKDRNGTTFIDGRRFPDQWYFATDSQEIIDARDALGENGSMLDVPMYRGNRIVMMSPGGDASPKVDNTSFTRDLEYVYASARPIDGFPITRAVASLYQETRVMEVPLETIPGSAFISNPDPITDIYYGGFVTVYNARGDARVEELAAPGRITRYQTCADRPDNAFGSYGMPFTGNLNELYLVGCRYLDAGQTVEEGIWTEVPEEQQGIRFSRAVHVVSKDVVLRATQTPGFNAMQRSTDGGRTWAHPSEPSTTGYINDYHFLDDQTGFAAGGDGNIWKTTDAGDTWRRITQGFTTESFFSIDFYDDDHGIVSGSKGAVLVTTNGGDSWTPLTVFAPGNTVLDYGKLSFDDVAYIDRNTIALSVFDAVIISYDGGAFWEINEIGQMTPNETCIQNAGPLHFPTRSTGYFIGCLDDPSIFKTTDKGRTWTKVRVPSDQAFTNVHFFDANNGMVIGNKMYRTTDGGLTWYRMRASSRTDVFYRHVHFNDGTGVLVGQRATAGEPSESFVLHTQAAEDDLTLGPEGRPFSIAPRSVLRYDGDPLQINGATNVDEAAAEFSKYDYVILGDLDLYDSNIPIYALIQHPLMTETRVFVGVDVGVTTKNLQGSDLAVQIVSYPYVYLANMGREYGVDRARQNEALNWAYQGNTTVVMDGDPDELFSTEVDAQFNPDGATLNVDDIAYYLYTDYLVDEGAYVDQTTWRQGSEHVNQYRKELGFRVLATTSGTSSYEEDAFYYAWHGALMDNFFAVGWGEPGYAINSNQAPYRERPELTPGRSYFSEVMVNGSVASRETENGEVSLDFATSTYTYGVSVMPTSTDDPEGVVLPERLALHQNYPNPFNGMTTIPFEIEQAGPVRLEVYDLLGRRVASLLEGVHTAGQHQVQLDASSLASGVYLYRIEAGGRSETRRMMVVR